MMTTTTYARIAGTHGTYTLTRHGQIISITRDGVWAGDWTLAAGTTADLGDDQDVIEAACIRLIEAN